MSSRGWHENLILQSLAHTLSPWVLTLIPQAPLGGRILDLLAISRAGYGTEYEIKCSLSDWNRDRYKTSKWSQPARKYIKRFVYAIAPHLESKIPDWVGPEVGIVVAQPESLFMRVVRTGANNKDAVPFSDAEIARQMHHIYNRCWSREMRALYDLRCKFDEKSGVETPSPNLIRSADDDCSEFKLEGLQL